jgi:hypothetical protein
VCAQRDGPLAQHPPQVAAPAPQLRRLRQLGVGTQKEPVVCVCVC